MFDFLKPLKTTIDMQNPFDEIDKAKRKVAEDKLKEAISILLNLDSKWGGGEYQNSLINQQSALSSLNKRRFNGIASSQELEQSRRKILTDILDIADLVSEIMKSENVEEKIKKSVPKTPVDNQGPASGIAGLIAEKIQQAGGSVSISLLKGGKSFDAKLEDWGVRVSNLGTQGKLPWKVFEVAIEFLKANGGKGVPGNAISGKLGDEKLPINSVEGQIAIQVYGKEEGSSVFRRITPVRSILMWVGAIEYDGKHLILKPF